MPDEATQTSPGVDTPADAFMAAEASLFPLEADQSPAVSVAPEDTGVTVTLVRPCRFTHKGGRVEVFKKGVHVLPPELAENWFILAHSDNPPPPQLKVGTPAYVNNERAKAAAEAITRAAEETQALQAAEQKRDELRAAKKRR